MVPSECPISGSATLANPDSFPGYEHQKPSPDGHDGGSPGSQEGRHFENGELPRHLYERWNGVKRAA